MIRDETPLNPSGLTFGGAIAKRMGKENQQEKRIGYGALPETIYAFLADQSRGHLFAGFQVSRM
jgi:hypothetical protein